jgi:hypothetical protein
MQTGSIANWLLKEGDEFQPGTAICEIETDKAVVTYDATEDGILAKILVRKGDIQVRIIGFIPSRIFPGWTADHDHRRGSRGRSGLC